MTKITFYKKNNLIIGFEVKGHTGKDEFGKDLLCAQLSTVAQLAVVGVEDVGKMKAFHEISDGQTINIIGLDFKFLDTHAKKDEMFGFIASDEHKKVAFVGDEILKNELYDTVRDIDFLMLDALCIGKENKNVLHLRESLEDFLTRTQHSSVKTASLLAKELNIKNLILFHTLDNYKLRKFRYKNEAKKYFNGKVFVPNKFDKINIL